MPIRQPKATYRDYKEAARDISDILKGVIQDGQQPVRYNTDWIPCQAMRDGASAPDATQIKDNGGGSTGVFAMLFDAATEEELHTMWVPPHSWAEDTAIEPVIKWAPVNSNAGNVVWGLEYTIIADGSAFGATTLATVTSAASTTAYAPQRATFGSISMPGKKIAHTWAVRLYRDAASGSDTYASDAAGLALGFNIKHDTGRGSHQQWTKWE